MDFFEKLFPYKSIIHIDGNTLTVYWVIATIIICVVGLYPILKTIRLIRKDLKDSINNLPDNTIDKSPMLNKIWMDYKDTFIKLSENQKTDEYAYDYFNEKNLLESQTNLKLISSIPSLLVGFGVLGTFVGLTYGISNFSTTSTEQIKNSIELLLSGMGTAFVSSIWGMGLSLLFTYVEKYQIGLLHNLLYEFCYKLDKQYKISKEDERIIELGKQEKLLSDYFVFTDENNNKVIPANFFRDIYDESIKQSKAMQSFSTDLAIKIESGFEAIVIS
ncbi:MAG: hypothetical protein DKM50_05635 [Candidatus Margulisiibacteriota bacterium]|nr:MAG: hypothetical protein DKM50_05635 [Candidatus Margulisiibacteriota bacterium]